MGLLVIACNVLTVCLALYSVFVTARERPLNSSYKAEFPVDVTNGTEHAISKRDIPQTNALTESMRKEILDLHNQLRAGSNASNMMMMVYDMNLEPGAQAWAEGCKFEHSPDASRQNKAGYATIGENLGANSGPFKATFRVQSWYDEIIDYDYSRGVCIGGRMCGHYKQVVWHNSKAVGCGVKWCKPFELTGWESGHHFVCHYGPAGNVMMFRPFKRGEACSLCPDDAKNCINGLCSSTASPESETSAPGSPQASPTASPPASTPAPAPPGGKASSQLRTSWTGLMLMFVIHLIVIGTV